MPRYSKGGRHLLISVNEDSRAALRLLDASTFKPLPLGPMPDGLVRGMRVSSDDQRVAFYASNGSVPDDLYVGPIGEPKKQLTTALSAKIRREDLVVPSVVRFKSYDGVEIPGVLYKPHQASAGNKAPALVMVHGGPGGQAIVGYFALVQALVNRGFVVFDINNRGTRATARRSSRWTTASTVKPILATWWRAVRCSSTAATSTPSGSASSAGATAATWFSRPSRCNPRHSRRAWTCSAFQTGSAR